jgi:hypothetical protein
MTERVRKIIRSFKIDEVSAVRKPASEFALVKIMKSDTRGDDPAESDLETVRKLAADGLLADFEKHQFIDMIHLHADDIRRDGETVEKAFARCIESDPCGRELYALMKAAPGTEVKVERDAKQDNVKPTSGPARAKLEALARDRQRTSERSFQQCYSDVLDDPANCSLRVAANREREIELMGTIDIFDAQRLSPAPPFPAGADSRGTWMGPSWNPTEQG